MTYQVDDVRRSLLVTTEKETLTGVGSPGNVVDGSLSVLLALLVGVEGLGLESLRSEEEEVLAAEQVPEGELR